MLSVYGWQCCFLNCYYLKRKVLWPLTFFSLSPGYVGAPVVWGSILGSPVLPFQYHFLCCSANYLRTPQLPPGSTTLSAILTPQPCHSPSSFDAFIFLLFHLEFCEHFYASCLLSSTGCVMQHTPAFSFVSCTCLLSKISPWGTEGWGILPSYFLVTQCFVHTVHPESFTRWSSSMF